MEFYHPGFAAIRSFVLELDAWIGRSLAGFRRGFNESERGEGEGERERSMKTMIEDYRNYPGEHCGSVAMRGLLGFYCGLELPEDVVFGLGAGVDCAYLSLPGMSPSVFSAGRTATMEVDLAAALGVDYDEQPDPDDERAWQDVREEVLAGRPTMLTGDIFYLDYRDYKVHFPAHRFVLLGFDDENEVAYIADRIRDEPEACSYPALFESRNPPAGISTQNLWGRFRGSQVKHDLTTACRIAVGTCARRMLGEESPQPSVLTGSGASRATSGIAGIERLAEELPGWGERDDAVELASFNASCIEKFGNGGGNFRRLYAGFLRWAHELDPERVPAEAADLAVGSADKWTALAHMLWANSEGADRWGEAAREASEIAGIERQLFELLARRGSGA
jgi:hypothetical protein